MRITNEVLSRVLQFEDGYTREATTDSLSAGPPSPVRAHVVSFLQTPLAQYMLNLVQWLEDCIDKHPECSQFLIGETDRDARVTRKASASTSSYRHLPISVQWSPHHCILHVRDVAWALRYDAFLEVHAKISDVLSLLVYAEAAAGVYLPSDASAILHRAIRLICDYHVADPTGFFSVIKALEGLGIGQVLAQAEQWSTVNDEFLTEPLAGFRQDGQGYLFAKRWISFLSMQTIPMQTELSCLAKIGGHPFVDAAGGVAKVRKRATAEVQFEEGTADRLSDLAKA